MVVDDDTYADPSQEFLKSLATSSGDTFPFISDHNSSLYYSAGAEVLLVAPGGEIVAGGEYASDISAEDIESVLP